MNPSVAYTQWWSFSVTNYLPIVPGTEAFLYFVVGNDTGPAVNPTGLRVEFFASSTFN